jgi:hypothetical protein
MTSVSYLGIALFYLVTIKLVTLLFSPHNSQSFALNAFSSSDPLGLLAFLSFGTSILASFPLIFFTMRNWFLQQAKDRLQWNDSISNFRRMTALLLFLIGGLCVVCKDIGKVGSVSGALLGSSMMFIFPSLMYIYTLWNENKMISEGHAAMGEQQVRMQRGNNLKIMLNILLLIGGIGIGSIGSYNSIKSLF